MSDWYASSAAYAAISTFVAGTAYTVGQIVKPTAPAFAARFAFRCTVAGTAGTEPSWPAANNATITTGGATFANVTGQSTYNWSAAAGTLASLMGLTNNRPAAGDRVFLSSDHSESNSTATTWAVNALTNAFGLVQIISVNRAGSVPPVAGDITNGASIATSSGNIVLDAYCNIFWQGVTISSNADIRLNGTATKTHYFKNCALVISGSGSTARIGSFTAARVVLDNTTVQFGSTSQALAVISTGTFELVWINTPSAIAGATIPLILFSCGTVAPTMSVTCRGVDLSAVTGTLCSGTTASHGGGMKALFDSCRIASGVTRLATPATITNSADEAEFVNCYDGTNVLNERYTYAGAITTDRSTTLSGGAQDDVGNYSLKLVSSSRADKLVLALDAFAFDVENTTTGASKTATVEIISSGSLNDDDISLLLQYMGTSGNPIASFGSSFPATALTTGAALGSSSETWNSPPGTPQKQKMQVTFTPERAGRVRGLVRLGKVSATVWVDPRVVIS